MKKFTLDATGKKIGRIASQAAKILIGKESTDFARNIVADVKVEITNVSKADIPLIRLTEEKKARYSHFPGGLKTPTGAQIVDKKGIKGLFRDAVYGMLPHNKLQSKMIKNLTITE